MSQSECADVINNFIFGVYYKYSILFPIVSQPSKCLKFAITINFTKMKEDNICQLGDYDAPFCEQQYTQGLNISLCSNSNHFIS